MAGRNQHHIPRMFLKGFATKGRGKWEQTIVVRREGQVFSKGIDKVAVGFDFYSVPSTDEGASLDDVITDYERRLRELITQLRSIPAQEAVAAELAAEVVAHLVPRSSSLRDIAQVGISKLLDSAEGMARSPDWLVDSLALEHDEPIEMLREKIATTLESLPGIENAPVPLAVIERMAYAMLQENAMELAQVEMPEVQDLITQFRDKAPEALQQGHRKSLLENLVQPVRRAYLAGLDWRIIEVSLEGAILPDCVALVYVRPQEQWLPLMAADMETTSAVVMPLTASTLLVGTVKNQETVDLSEFNLHAAKCSSNFFISQIQTSALTELASKIGSSTGAFMDGVVEDALAKAARKPVIDSGPKSGEPWALPVSDANFVLQGPGDMGSTDLDSLVIVIKKASAVTARNGGLDKLDGISFTADLPAKIGKIAELYGETSATADFAGTALVVQYMVEGMVRLQILMKEEYAWGLIDQDDEKSAYAVQCLLAEMGEAQLLGLLDLALPGSLGAPPADFHAATLYEITVGFIVAYYRARFCAEVGPDSLYGDMARARLIATLTQGTDDLDALRAEYRDGEDIGPAYQAALGIAARRLYSAASYIGVWANDPSRDDAPDEEISVALEAAGLHKWLPRLVSDLDRFWLWRGRWESMDEIYKLNFHVERMLWQIRVVIWPIEGGQTYVRLLS